MSCCEISVLQEENNYNLTSLNEKNICQSFSLYFILFHDITTLISKNKQIKEKKKEKRKEKMHSLTPQSAGEKNKRVCECSREGKKKETIYTTHYKGERNIEKKNIMKRK